MSQGTGSTSRSNNLDGIKWRAIRSGLRNSKTLLRGGAYARGDLDSRLKRKFCQALIISEFYTQAIHEEVEASGKGNHIDAWHVAFERYRAWWLEQDELRRRRESRLAKSRSRSW